MIALQSSQIPILICIDIEPQQRAIGPGLPEEWVGFPETWDYFTRLRPALEEATRSPVRFNWFLRMDPQISETYGSADWAVTRYRGIFDEMLHAGDEIGIHPHAWRFDRTGLEWYSDFGDKDWIERCVFQSLEQFEKSFSASCRSFRFGDGWLNQTTFDLVERLGIEFDLTIEPGRQGQSLPERFTGSMPDFSSAPRSPYQPSEYGYLNRGDVDPGKLVVIPVSTVDPRRLCVSPRDPSSFALAKQPWYRLRRYEGYVDLIDNNWIAGWVYDARHPDQTVFVELIADGKSVSRHAADIFRFDLLVAGKGSGAHGFYIPQPQEWRDGRSRSVGIRVAGSSFELRHSPRELTLSAQSSVDYWAMNLAGNSELFARGLDALLVEEQVHHLNLILRTDGITGSTGRAYLERNIERLVSHPLVEKLVFSTPRQAMNLLDVARTSR